MTTDVAVKESTDIIITSEQVEIIKNTVCKEATPAEMQLYFYDCKRRGCHPLDRLIHFTKRGGRYVPITSIDFLYQRAHATDQFAGQDETVFKGTPGKPGFEATVRVYRQRPGSERGGWSATARWDEYYPGDQQGHMWKKMPTRMLEKCAEALALRKAFPAELQGLYVKEEMDQSEATSAPPQAAPKPTAPDKAASVLSKMQRTELRPVEAEVLAEAPTLTPQQLAERMEMAESTDELSSVMNSSIKIPMSAEDRATLKGVFDLQLARLKPGKRG